MDQNEALAILKPHLKQERYDHTVRVMETAIQLAGVYGVDEKKAEIAAIFHDYAKYRPTEEMKKWITSTYLPKDLLHYHHELWHGPVGALLVEREVGITDVEVLDSIHYHTTGRTHMTPLDKVIFLADYIEPGRKFPGIDDVREAAQVSLDYGCWMATKNTIAFLMSKNQPIYPDTFYAYNALTKRKNNKQEGK
ncbi:bis(5'-nucleosyl)-tetraphosphatase (symmetrical) YqeK [Pontibacillus salipaludis]|uniref:bis(5'-nucleosyl)-tetraphosphatase (symmetrical) n=1 Tax=Pontibacillus salipaludis TaxID=1697394 RepID=A0ABQ1PV80_9BACI|nr:bis(5'-nucleosyl)-tetraphosphatase (symmetrical) YqeK [Pontibacillus salipaludis]GGD04265.1 HD domain-containing protein [Pontibacillus salipaludis]